MVCWISGLLVVLQSLLSYLCKVGVDCDQEERQSLYLKKNKIDGKTSTAY